MLSHIASFWNRGLPEATVAPPLPEKGELMQMTSYIKTWSGCHLKWKPFAVVSSWEIFDRSIYLIVWFPVLQWRDNGCDGIPNQQPPDCLLNGLFRRRSKKTSKLRVAGLFVGRSPVTGEFPAQMASYAENVSIWWRHHGFHKIPITPTYCLRGDLESLALTRFIIGKTVSVPKSLKLWGQFLPDKCD